MKTAIQAELPQKLVTQARAFVEQGWTGDFNEVLRRYLDSHSSRFAEWFIREDVSWVCMAGSEDSKYDRAKR